MERRIPTRVLEAAEGREWPRRWRARQHAVAATGRFPFRDHRTMAQVMADEAARP